MPHFDISVRTQQFRNIFSTTDLEWLDIYTYVLGTLPYALVMISRFGVPLEVSPLSSHILP
jgi:hypothetical protein